jgi:O-antigen/teichoic acid export membrane protein
MSQKKRLFHNGIATAIQKGILIAQQLLLVPFFITAWGAAYYGEWLTLTIIPTILGLSELGFGTAAANSFVLKYASGNKQGAANIAKTGFRIVLMMVLLSVLLSAITILTLNYFHVFNKSLIDKNQAIIAVSFLMVARILNFFQPLNEAHFRAARRVSLSINLQSIYSALNVVIGLIVLLCKGGIIIFAFTNLINSIIFTVIYALISRKVLPLHKTHLSIIDKTEIKSIVHKGFGYLLSPVWQSVFFQGTTFVVRIVLGPVAVTVFNTVRTLTRAVNQANAMVIASVLPELQFEIGAGNLPQARKIFRFGLTIITLIALAGMIFLFFGGPWFYEIWTRKALNPPAMMWNIFIVGIIFSGIWGLSSDVLIASNKPYDFTIIGTFVAAFAVLISYFLSKQYGITGAALGSLLLDIILFITILPKSCKLIRQSLKTLFIDSITDFKLILISYFRK